jgi:glycine betaine/proline transport system substrate-binding protein
MNSFRVSCQRRGSVVRCPTWAEEKVVFSDVGWTDISATCHDHADSRGVGLRRRRVYHWHLPRRRRGRCLPGQLDAFNGPTSHLTSRPARSGRCARTAGAVYTGHKPAGALGIRDFANLAAHQQDWAAHLWIEPGNDGNRLILEMIRLTLSDFGFTWESSSRACSLKWRASRERPIVFLGWEPHPMGPCSA